jgi:hypothetical protein
MMGRTRSEPITIRAAIDANLGYLICGFVVLAASEAASDGKWLFQSNWQPESIVLFGTLSWSAGYGISRMSRVLLEHKFVRGFLKSSEETLLADRGHGDRTWRKALFPSWYRPLTEETRDRILRAAAADGFGGPGSALLRHAFDVVHQEPAVLRRLQLYRQLSDICRSLCVGFCAVSAILVAGIIWHGVYARLGQSDLRKLAYSAWSLFEAVGMLYRYLKFYRQHTLGVLIGYAEFQEGQGLPGGPAPDSDTFPTHSKR